MSEQDKMAFEEAMQKKFGWNNTEHILHNPSEYSDMVYQHVYYACEGWQAATTEANKRMVELEARHERDISEYTAMREVNAELKANNHDLREAINEAISTYNLPVTARLAEALAATPAESLQAFENSVIEKCAKVCDEDAIKSREFAEPFAARVAAILADEIRALKEVK